MNEFCYEQKQNIKHNLIKKNTKFRRQNFCQKYIARKGIEPESIETQSISPERQFLKFHFKYLLLIFSLKQPQYFTRYEIAMIFM